MSKWLGGGHWHCRGCLAASFALWRRLALNRRHAAGADRILIKSRNQLELRRTAASDFLIDVIVKERLVRDLQRAIVVDSSLASCLDSAAIKFQQVKV